MALNFIRAALDSKVRSLGWEWVATGQSGAAQSTAPSSAELEGLETHRGAQGSGPCARLPRGSTPKAHPGRKGKVKEPRPRCHGGPASRRTRSWEMHAGPLQNGPFSPQRLT